MSTSSRRKSQVAVFWVAVSFFAAHLCFWLLPRVFEPWNAQTVDQLFKLRSRSDRLRPVYDDTVVHVDLNNSSIRQLNNFYLNRSHFARLISNLAAMASAVQAFDFIFAARSNEEDDRGLIEATAKAANVYFGMALAFSEGTSPPAHRTSDERHADETRGMAWMLQVEGDATAIPAGASPLPTFAQLASVSRGMGFLSLKPDGDGVFRRVPLVMRVDGGFCPSLAFRVACDYLGVTPERILLRAGRSITLKGARTPGGTPHDIIIPIDGSGNLAVNFVGPWERMKHYSFADALRASEDKEELKLWREELRGKIVVVSDVSTGSTDIGTVPTDVSFPLSGVHANVIHTIVSGQFLREFRPTEILLMDLLLGITVLLIAIGCSPRVFVAGTFVLAASYVGLAALLFLYLGLIPNLVRPLFFLAFSTISLSIHRYFDAEKEKEVLRRTFEAYFPPSVVKKVVGNPGLLRGQRKVLTVLFSDIQGFTTSSAAMTPDEVQRYLNEYFDEMVQIVFSHQGTVDKYIGDGLMVFFGDPEFQPDHALRCVRAAVEMQKKARELHAKWQKEGGMPLRIRVGINTGEVLVGNMGSARRLTYTVLGSEVNLAQRLEANAPQGGILVSRSTYELVKEEVTARSLGEIRVKGLDSPVSVFEIPVETTPDSTAEPRQLT